MTMTSQMDWAMNAECRCGKVKLEVTGAPILHAICYCRDCQEAGRRHQATPGANQLVGADGGTDCVLYRKDRITCTAGGDLLDAQRLKPESLTRRMIARCCNTAIALDFTAGHWLTLYRGRLDGPVPPATMRINTASRPEGVTLPDDVRNYPSYPKKFMLRLLLAWAGMRFRRPSVAGLP